MSHRSGFYIDKITKSIEEVRTGRNVATEVLLLSHKDLKITTKKNGWFFNWKLEYNQAGHRVFKLNIEESEIIQGLISIEPMDNYVEMHLVENAPHNYGSKKQFAGVAGNLVAFACKTSFDLGFDGCVAFTAKTKLVNHYIETLGARVIYGKERMGIFTEAAGNLVNSYYKNYLHGR
ncbi:MAG TPA: hypothetical protein VI548_05105 [Chitinophagaceae bacterium]|nr:hypothetical protein [Chitinophagaceae bacterium]